MLRDKVAFITGSAKGLGKTTALRLANEGCNIALNYVHSQAEAEALKRVIESKEYAACLYKGISLFRKISRG